MTKTLLDLIRCPNCTGQLRYAEHPKDDGYGILVCGCGSYPVVAGIPVLKHGALIDRVRNLVTAGQHRDALCTMLMSVPTALRRRRMRLARWLWRHRARAFLAHPERVPTVRAWFRFLHDEHGYFGYCWGVPRYLSSLALITLIRDPQGPVLDLGCGYGHLARHLVVHAGSQAVIGLDRDFQACYIAQGWMAPEARYVCADADTSLPFADDTFAALLSANAFHLFVQKASCAREMSRVLRPDGLLLLTGLRNRLVQSAAFSQASHQPLDPQGYAALVKHLRPRVIGTTAIMTSYLKRCGPALATPQDADVLLAEQWLCLVASHDPNTYQDHKMFCEWPHARGRLVLNPLYVPDGPDADGRQLFRFQIPYPRFRDEDLDCTKYLPPTLTLDTDVLRHLDAGEPHAVIDELLAQCIVVGLPERW